MRTCRPTFDELRVDLCSMLDDERTARANVARRPAGSKAPQKPRQSHSDEQPPSEQQRQQQQQEQEHSQQPQCRPQPQQGPQLAVSIPDEVTAAASAAEAAAAASADQPLYGLPGSVGRQVWQRALPMNAPPPSSDQRRSMPGLNR